MKIPALNPLRNWINNNGWFVFIVSILPIVVATIAELRIPHPFSFDTSHTYFFMCIIILSIKFMYDSRLTSFDIVCVIILQTLISMSGLYSDFAEWVTTHSPIAFLFATLPATGGPDLISTILIVLNTLILCIILVYKHKKTKRWDLNRIFFVIGTGAFIVTTFLFHIVTVEMGYRGYEAVEKAKIIKALKLERDQHFKLICDYQGYICTLDGIKGVMRIVGEQEKKLINSIPKEYEWVTSIGNFKYHLGNEQRSENIKRIGIFKYKNRWLIDYTHFDDAWLGATSKFFLLCSVAHIFWAYFTVFLIFSHNKRIQKKKASLT